MRIRIRGIRRLIWTTLLQQDGLALRSGRRGEWLYEALVRDEADWGIVGGKKEEKDGFWGVNVLES